MVIYLFIKSKFENALNWIQNIPNYDIDNMNKDIDVDEIIKIEEQILLKRHIMKMFRFILQRKGEEFGELLYQFIFENDFDFGSILDDLSDMNDSLLNKYINKLVSMHLLCKLNLIQVL